MGAIDVKSSLNVFQKYREVIYSNSFIGESAGSFEPETTAYISRVEADGGVVVDPAYVDAFIEKAKSLGILGNLIHWTSSRAGMKKDVYGRISKVYSYTGNNATQVLPAKQPLLMVDGIQFAGNNEHLFLGSIDSTNPLSLYPSQQGSVEYCLKVNGEGADSFPRIIDKSTAGNGANGWALYLSNHSTTTHSLAAGANGGITSSTTVSKTSFDHIIDTFNSFFGGDIYKNGSFSGTRSNYTPIPQGTAEMRIGAWNTDDRRDLEGVLKDLRVWDIQLTATQASELNSLFI